MIDSLIRRGEISAPQTKKNMKREYIIADGESGSFDTLRAAKMHLSFYSDKEYKQFVGCFIVGSKLNSDEIISLTEIKPNRKFGKTISNK